MFHPKDNILNLYKWVQSCLSSQLFLGEDHFCFNLSLSPPYKLLEISKAKDNIDTFTSLNLVPAALINLKWKEMEFETDLFNDIGTYLSDELMIKSEDKVLLIIKKFRII